MPSSKMNRQIKTKSNIVKFKHSFDLKQSATHWYVYMKGEDKERNPNFCLCRISGRIVSFDLTRVFLFDRTTV